MDSLRSTRSRSSNEDTNGPSSLPHAEDCKFDDDCKPIPVDEQKMLELIDQGEVPLAVCKENENGGLELYLEKWTPNSIYTAITHVRAFLRYLLSSFLRLSFPRRSYQ